MKRRLSLLMYLLRPVMALLLLGFLLPPMLQALRQ